MAAPPTMADLARKSRRVSTAAESGEKEKAAAVPTRRAVPRMRAEVRRMVLRLFSLTVGFRSMEVCVCVVLSR